MVHCHVCGYTKEKEECINEMFQIGNKPVLVEDIPAMVCLRCGEETISHETAEHIRLMLHSHAKPKQSISMDVFAYA